MSFSSFLSVSAFAYEHLLSDDHVQKPGTVRPLRAFYACEMVTLSTERFQKEK